MSYMSKYRWQPLALVITCLLANQALYAQTASNDDEKDQVEVSQKAPKALELGRVVVKAQEEAGYGKSAGGVASVSLSKEQVERFRGTGNGDAFQGVSGLQVNSVRNEAGALDVGIRGIQGEGRVPVYIDGSLQSTHTFRGYQGESDRTYIDMDLISSVTTEKGASVGKYGTGAVGGLIQMKTLGVDDVVKQGEKFGLLVKGSIFNNNKSVKVPDDEKSQTNYQLKNHQKGSDFRNGAYTLGVGYKGEIFDIMAAYNHRKVGNYFAGKHGRDRLGFDKNEIEAGQEVPNTSFKSDSGIVKFGINITDDQRLDVNFRRHVQRAGEVLSFYWGKYPRPDGYDYTSQWKPGSAQVNTTNIEYRYNPLDNSLIDLNMSLWQTKAKLHQFNGAFTGSGHYGDQYLESYKDDRKGFNIDNTSTFDEIPVTLYYGYTYDEQRMKSRGTYIRDSARDAKRKEQSVFLNMSYSANLFDFGVNTRLHKSSILDYNGSVRSPYGFIDPATKTGPDKRRFGTKFDWSSNIAFHVNDNIDLYARYSDTYRTPSLFEGSISGQTYSYDGRFPLKPENARTYEFGVAGNYQDLLSADDSLSFGVNYFHNDMRNFLTAGEKSASKYELSSYTFVNYSKFLMKGVELNFAYDHPSFFVEANATIYSNPKICPDSVSECGQQAKSSSLIPTRIPPKRLFNLTVGKHFFNKDLTIGGRLRYHSNKSNPEGWMAGTGITGRAVEYIPSERTIDLFAKYSLNRDTEFTMNIDNLTNRYTLDPGTVIGMPQPGRTIRLGFEMKF